MIDLLYPDILMNKIKVNLEIVNFLLANFYNSKPLNEEHIFLNTWIMQKNLNIISQILIY